MKDRLEDRAHLIVLSVGLLNVVVLPFGRLAIARAERQAVGCPLFGLGLALNVLSLLALKGGIGSKIEPATELVSRAIYGRLRHPMYLSFTMTMLALDLLLGSVLGILFTLAAFLPSMVWRARLEEQAMAQRFGEAWKDYVEGVPSLLLWDFGKRQK